jgi:hypothetical protein
MTMNKEWKAELRGLLKEKRSIVKHGNRALLTVNKRLLAAEREARRDRQRIEKNTLRASARVDQRIAVLEGRLAS